MPKRNSSAGSSTPSPSKKRSKTVADQHSLDRYFGAKVSEQVRSAPQSPAKDKVKAEPHRFKSTRDTVGTDSAIADDEALAWKLAEQDGLDVEALRRLENAASNKATSEPKTSRNQHRVIDVDLLDDTGEHSQHQDATAAVAARSAFGSTFAGSVSDIAYSSLAVDPVSYVFDDDTWRPNTPVPYSFLAHTLSTLSGTRSRIVIINTLTNSLRTITKQHPLSLLPALYLLSNSLSPPYSPIELGLGPSTITKAIQHVSGLTPAALRRLYNTTGDPGDVAFEAKSNVRTLIPHPPLLIIGVYESLVKIAHAKGQGAANQKQNIVEKLLVAAKGEEVRFLVRTLCLNLRVGAVRTSLLTALSRAVVLTPPSNLPVPVPSGSLYHASDELLSRITLVPEQSKKKIVDPARDELNTIFAGAEALLKKVYVQHPNYDHITQALLEAGIPLLPTLGSPTRSLDEIYDRLGLLAFTAEFKYDGQRAQIHASKDGDLRVNVKIFSRHLEDMTDKYPDIVLLVQGIFRSRPEVQSFIIDAEIVAINPVDGSIKTFQELSNRARKDVKVDEIKVPVCVFAFDLMCLDGEILLERSFRQRRALLRERFPPLHPERKDAARFDHVQSCESEDGREAIEEFWQTALNSSCEGLMIKLLDHGEVVEELNQKEKPRRKPLPATYEPDKRTSAWLKLKKDYVTGLGDSLDLVPIGAWHGNGRKARWWSPILLAVRDSDTGKLVAVCKCMSGFSDAFYKSLGERYPENSDTCSPQPLWDPECETGGLRPEVFFKPQEVWEIRGADITISPVSVAAIGLVNQNRGLSLRFPRFMKMREDKHIEDASTPEFLANMWRTQQATGKDQVPGADDGELVDVDLEEDDVAQSEEEE
ncbi:hypothetical protein POSPLADRAFT_1043869 [Postia placenta MAD-698-R-SB12]|uniref:DNA ligase n=1 Tax=Postia placenta MAD-698-R-SB12 TaxID=670580 RepID=A0A1X6NCY6_9APHY|nr:hypothetical protein POSPLADRAFT_1043869 [Postia placenta MAD-698-R-SB12]OSX66434.1 hypothetical protein POSPLADRAFT_1043869 [Postia placenta MAD-698-R-SB12]